MISFKEEANKVTRENAIDIQLGKDGEKDYKYSIII